MEAYAKDGDDLGETLLVVERLGPGKTARGENAVGRNRLTTGHEKDVHAVHVTSVTSCDKGDDPTGNRVRNGS